MNLSQFIEPLVFDQVSFSQALDNYDVADPHRRADELDDDDTAPQVNVPLYDTSITNPISKSNNNLEDFPDYSDEVMSDYQMQRMLGKPINIPSIVDLDTAPDYVDFIKNTIKNVISSETEFNIQNTEISEILKQVKNM
jgi:hypothetical protein